MNTQEYKWEEMAPFNDNNSCVIEFQAFRGNNNKYIVKELVILDIKSGVTNYFLFKPPFSCQELNGKSVRTNNWLSKYFHHISWHEGFTDYRELQHILVQYCKKYKQVFTSGLEKCELLSLYAPSEVTIYNICRQRERNITGICIGVISNKHTFSNCAMSNAYALRATLQTESRKVLFSGGDKVVGVLGHK